MIPSICEGKFNYTKIPVGITPSGIVYDQDNNNIYVIVVHKKSPMTI
jgi:hypothetical protein